MLELLPRLLDAQTASTARHAAAPNAQTPFSAATLTDAQVARYAPSTRSR
jgi:hypothetical protein